MAIKEARATLLCCTDAEVQETLGLGLYKTDSSGVGLGGGLPATLAICPPSAGILEGVSGLQSREGAEFSPTW